MLRQTQQVGYVGDHRSNCNQLEAQVSALPLAQIHRDKQ